jgi:rare lipoprotein A
VLERRRRAEQIPVALAREDGAPVREIRERGDAVAADSAELPGLRKDHRVERDGRYEREHRGEEPARAADPEDLQIDAAGRAVLGEEQRRDQEARQHEEQVDAEVPPTQLVVVEEEHADDRGAAQTVERGQVGDGRPASRSAIFTWVRAQARPGGYSRRRVKSGNPSRAAVLLATAALALGCSSAPPPPAAAPAKSKAGPSAAARVGAVSTGVASYYADSLAGRPTASGEPYDPAALTAAHRTLPFGTLVEVTRDDGRSVVVRINDRGPFGKKKRIIDLSRRAAEALGIVRAGVAEVTVRVVGRAAKK